MQWLIAISVAIYFLQLTVVRPEVVAGALGFHAGPLSETWWTVVTYMFVHAGFWHLALNMYTLFLFGSRVEREWSAAEFTRYFLLCGMGGLLLHLLFFRGSTLVGASAAVYGVMLAYARRWPDDEIYLFAVLPIKVKWFIALLVVMDLVNGVQSNVVGDGVASGGVAHFAHLGGYVGAFAYLKWIERGKQQFKRKVAAAPKDVDKRLVGWKQIDSAKVHEANRDEVDRLLDKISAKGLGALTPQERTFLSHFAPPDDRVPPVS